MYMMKLVTLLLGCLLMLAPCELGARMFTDVDGSKIDATITKVEKDTVSLLVKADGKVYDSRLSIFRPNDRKYIRDWVRRQELEAAYNFDDPWPTLINTDLDIEIEITEEDEQKKRFVYHSPNYEFICDVRLSKNVVKKFATLFEATREYCRMLPIATLKAHVPGAQFRNKILLFESKASYVRNGGPPSSAGVFISRGRQGNGIVMVPLESLGLKKVGSGYMYDYKGENKVLPHELVHQLTDREYYRSGARGWFSEGLAEYVAVTPYRSGKFMVRSNLSAVKAYATEYGKKGKGGRALGDEIIAPSLKDYMLQPYSEFTANANFNYGLGLLITNYYFHMEEDRSNITAFLRALKRGKQGEEALRVLLNGRSWDEMEEQITKAWRSRGVKITFRESVSR